MRSSLFLFLSIILFWQPCNCQTKANISDVDFHLEESDIVVNYNINGSLPKEQMTVELRFITENNESIIPKTVKGDVGSKIINDGVKTIRWDIGADQVILSGNLKAIVTITSSKILYGGPSNALLSVIIPGLGGYFVDNSKIRSVVTTITTVGLIGFGITQKLQSDKFYSKYNASIIPSEIEGLYTKANNAQHLYYITTRVGAGLWVMDIIWVTYKGFHNKKDANSTYGAFKADGLKLDYSNNGFQLGYTMSF